MRSAFVVVLAFVAFVYGQGTTEDIVHDEYSDTIGEESNDVTFESNGVTLENNSVTPERNYSQAQIEKTDMEYEQFSHEEEDPAYLPSGTHNVNRDLQYDEYTSEDFSEIGTYFGHNSFAARHQNKSM